LSVGLRYRSRWDFFWPDDWPRMLDQCWHSNGDVKEVSVRPSPLFHSTFGTVRVI
jgi:hypothetical protein